MSLASVGNPDIYNKYIYKYIYMYIYIYIYIFIYVCMYVCITFKGQRSQQQFEWYVSFIFACGHISFRITSFRGCAYIL